MLSSDAPAQLKNIRSVLGIEVRSSQEKNIGRVVDLLADRSGAVEAAVIEFGGFLGIGMRKIAISWSDLRFETDGKQLVAVLDIPRDQLRGSIRLQARPAQHRDEGHRSSDALDGTRAARCHRKRAIDLAST